MWRDSWKFFCRAKLENGWCECENDPSTFTDRLSYEGWDGHSEYAEDGTLIDRCETCRSDQAKRKVTDRDSVKVKPMKDLRQIEKDLESVELRR